MRSCFNISGNSAFVSLCLILCRVENKNEFMQIILDQAEFKLSSIIERIFVINIDMFVISVLIND